MWVKGYIYGFISKSECDNLLANHEDGTFTIRFSDRFPGKYATAYVFNVWLIEFTLLNILRERYITLLSKTLTQLATNVL